MSIRPMFVLVLASLPPMLACSTPPDAFEEDQEAIESSAHKPTLGRALPGISASDFNNAKAAFARTSTPDDGLGPIYNEAACGACHAAGATGGAGEVSVLRFGRFRSDGTFDTLSALGGLLLERQSLGTWTNKSGQSCTVPTESVPAEATVEGGRLTPPLFGLGLVDAMPDSFFVELAAAEPDAVRGIALGADIKLPDPRIPQQSVGGHRVGRFSWKAVVPSLLEFAAGAYLNEMGVTSQHCVRGQSIMAFASELAPNGVPVPVECQDNLPGTDDVVGACDGERTAIQENVAAFATFMTFLAPPPRRQSDERFEAASRQGERLFDRVGCARCHTPRTFTTPAHPFNGVPGNYDFHPFSDFLVHDMGALGDRIGNNGDSIDRIRMMRTAPLWGIRFRTRLLHDGRATSIPAAVAEHDGQAASASASFAALSAHEKKALVQFVLGL